MKTARMMRKMLLSMLLCCAMLVSTAFGAEMRQIRVGDVTITSNDPNVSVNHLSRAASRVFIDTSASCTSSKPFSLSGNCKPEDGKYLYFLIENTGNTDFNVRLTLTSNGESVTLNDPVFPEDPIYIQNVHSNTNNGLDCSFSIQITPRRSGETANFDIYISQSQS